MIIIDEEGGSEATHALEEAYHLALFSAPLLILYAVAQSLVGVVVVPRRPELRLVIEPFLLMLGLILHVQWRRVSHVYRENGLPRPRWIGAADCLSFVITFWAFAVLTEAFLQEAGLL